MAPVVEPNQAVLPIVVPEIAASETATPEKNSLGTTTPDIATSKIGAPWPAATKMSGSDVPILRITTLEVPALVVATPEVQVSNIFPLEEAAREASALEASALEMAAPRAIISKLPGPMASPPAVAMRNTSAPELFPGIGTPGLAALETSAVGGWQPVLIAPEMTEMVITPHAPEFGTENPKAAGPEFEMDSSPYATSSDDSSSDDSDDDYVMLDPAEHARLLMEGDAASDDEGGRKNAGNTQLRTVNEKPDEVVETPKVIVTMDMKIEELGIVENIIGNVVLVNAKTSGEYQVLETSSVLCLEDRTVIGVVSETIGRVEQPFYSVRFPNASAVMEGGITKGIRIYYVPQYSTFVFTQALKVFKGSDASNIHDEEVGDDELEFSDDEAEAEYKRNLRVKRQARRGGRVFSDKSSMNFPRRTESEQKYRKDDISMGNTSVTHLSYDDAVNDDGLYTPLVRPSNLQQESSKELGRPEQRQVDMPRHRGGRSRGDYNRGRGNDRGPGRGGRDQADRQTDSQRSLPPTPRSMDPMALSQPFLTSPAITPQYQHFPHQSLQNVIHAYGQPYGKAQFPTQLPNYPFPLSPSIPAYQSHHQQRPQGDYQLQHQQPHQRTYQQQQQRSQLPFSQSFPQSPSAYSNGSLPPGAFVNPAFFGNAYQQSPTLQTFPSSHMGHPIPERANSGDEQRNGPSASDVAFQAAQDKLRVLRQLAGSPH